MLAVEVHPLRSSAPGVVPRGALGLCRRGGRATPRPPGAALGRWRALALVALAAAACASQPLSRTSPREQPETGLSSEEPEVRLQAATALVERGGADSLKRVQVALSRESVAEVARQLLVFLARTGIPQARQVILQYQSHPNPDIARAAFDALVSWAHEGGESSTSPGAHLRPPTAAPQRHSRPSGAGSDDDAAEQDGGEVITAPPEGESSPEDGAPPSGPSPPEGAEVPPTELRATGSTSSVVPSPASEAATPAAGAKSAPAPAPSTPATPADAKVRRRGKQAVRPKSPSTSAPSR
jgi:hypothetical protein